MTNKKPVKPNKPEVKSSEPEVKQEDAQEEVKLARTEEKEVSPKEDTKKPVKVLVGSNPAGIQWPTDVWGFTAEFRKAVALLGQRTGSAEDKRALVIQHLEIAAAFLEAKFNSDTLAKKSRIKRLYGAQEEKKDAPESQGNPAE